MAFWAIFVIPLVVLAIQVAGNEGAGHLRGARQTQVAVRDAWAESADGKYFGVAAWDVVKGPSQQAYEQMYGKGAMDRAKIWVRDKRVLYCGNASMPDADLLGEFPFVAPTTVATKWPGACPNSGEAQEFFDKGLAFRMLFNDNEAVCAFKGAEHADPGCAMAILAQAYSMGPNVNYAELASSETYKLILEALKRAKDVLAKPNLSQSEYANALYAALLKFYCVDDDGALDDRLALDAKEAYSLYVSQMGICTHSWAVAISAIASQYPGDPNLQSIASGALMQDPAWKWWNKGSVIAGSLANVSLAADKQYLKQTAIEQASARIRPAAALANTAIEAALNTEPDHLGALHFSIHNLEQGPAPRWAESVADRLLKYSNHQGHAIHMQTHIATRIGNYKDSFMGNLLAVQADAEWNINRTGGGVSSLLYKYVPHNTAFAAEAAQHMANFKSMAAAIQSLNYCAGFGMLADPQMASLGNFLQRQMLQPLRFGKYEELISGLNGKDSPVSGIHKESKLSFHLPGNVKYIIDETTEGTETLRNSLSDIRLFVLVVSNARLGSTAVAEQNLLQLLSSPTLREGCDQIESANSTVMQAEALAACRFEQFLGSSDSTLGSNDASASGTLTINNGDNVKAIILVLAAAELQRAQGADEEALLQKAFEYQKKLYYDEPAPFFYPVGETLAGYYLRHATGYDKAESVLRTVLFQWPRSALASFALHSVLDREGKTTASAFALEDATRYNDTELSLEWL
jgi:hypothetical protein